MMRRSPVKLSRPRTLTKPHFWFPLSVKITIAVIYAIHYSQTVPPETDPPLVLARTPPFQHSHSSILRGQHQYNPLPFFLIILFAFDFVQSHLQSCNSDASPPCSLFLVPSLSVCSICHFEVTRVNLLLLHFFLVPVFFRFLTDYISHFASYFTVSLLLFPR